MVGWLVWLVSWFGGSFGYLIGLVVCWVGWLVELNWLLCWLVCWFVYLVGWFGEFGCSLVDSLLV